MSGLVARDGEQAHENIVEELQGGSPPFDPLMSMNWHWTNEALRCGGLYLMAVDAEANPANDGHYCPICEFVKHLEGFDAPASIGTIADQMAAHARSEGLIPSVS
nr:hypothetical protein [Mesorhizobium sp.]